MNLNIAPTSDAFMISICTFLANYSQLPQEISKRDEQFLAQFERMDMDSSIDNAK